MVTKAASKAASGFITRLGNVAGRRLTKKTLLDNDPSNNNKCNKPKKSGPQRKDSLSGLSHLSSRPSQVSLKYFPSFNSTSSSRLPSSPSTKSFRSR